MENFSSFKRVVGAVPETKKEEILDDKSRIFLEQDFPQLGRIEREKTLEERDIIELVDQATNEILEKYGAEGFVVPENNIHIVGEKDWPNELTGSAIYNSMQQAIVIRDAPAKIVFLKKLFHEMLHFKSYTAAQVIEDRDAMVDKYRVGITVVSRDGEKEYFKFLNEAVTEELTKRFVTELFQNPLFEEEKERTAEIMERYPEAKTSQGRKLFDEEVFYADTSDSDSWKDSIGRLFGAERNRKIITEGFTYNRERLFLETLVNRIYQENTESFADSEEVYDLFARAAFSGNLLTIGKLIDKTFGQGTFRKIGEMSEDESLKEEMFNLVQTA